MIAVLASGTVSDSSWTYAQTAIIIVAVIAIAGSVVSASITFLLNQRAVRRERRANAFAEALAALEDYAELPYRIRRRPDSPEAVHALTEEISKVQSRLAYYQALLQIEAPDVAAEYIAMVGAAKKQAGSQMRGAWKKSGITTPAEMSLRKAYRRDEIDAARDRCVEAMQRSIRSRYVARDSRRRRRGSPPSEVSSIGGTAERPRRDPGATPERFGTPDIA